MRRESFKIRKLIRKWNRKTGRFHIDIRYKARTKITPRTIGVAEAFGLGVDEYREHVIYDDVTIKLNPRDIVYITSESGSGKSVLLRALEKNLGDEAINIEDVKIAPSKPLVDTLGENLDQSLELLSRVGLNDDYLFIRHHSQHSDGQIPLPHRQAYRVRQTLLDHGRARDGGWTREAHQPTK